MTDCPFSAPCLYFLISVYEIPGLAGLRGTSQGRGYLLQAAEEGVRTGGEMRG